MAKRERELFEAAERGDAKVVTKLLSAETDSLDVNTRGEKGRTALLAASRGGHHEMVQMLCSAGAVVNMANDVNVTPLHLAAAGGSTKCVSLLLAFKADPTLRDDTGKSAMDYASCKEVTKLLEAGSGGASDPGARGNMPSYTTHVSSAEL
jgi:ankyrin repeat protein